MLIEQKVIHSLIDTKKTLAVAESCTGGLLSHRLTHVPGASECLKFGIVAYSNDAKKRFLKVPASILRKHGAVSEQAAVAMAKGARRHFDSDFGLSITGIAGPSGGTKQKPVGLTYIAVHTKKETLCLKCRFQGTRKQIKKQASTEAVNLLAEFLE